MRLGPRETAEQGCLEAERQQSRGVWRLGARGAVRLNGQNKSGHVTQGGKAGTKAPLLGCARPLCVQLAAREEPRCSGPPAARRTWPTGSPAPFTAREKGCTSQVTALPSSK